MTQLPPPGWYPDPVEPERRRYWDGTQWADQTPPPAAPTAAPGTTPSPYPSYGATPGAPYGAPYGAAPPYGSPHGTPYGAAPPYGSPYGAMPSGPPTANWGRRLLARIVDGLAVGLISFVVYPPLWIGYLHDLQAAVQAAQTGGTAPTGLGTALLAGLLSTIVYFGYDLLQHRAFGRTLGKRLLRLRVIPLAGGESAADARLGWGQATIRAAVWTLPPLVPYAGSLFTLLDGLWPLWDRPFRQALHDKAAGTRVVPVR